MVLPTDSRGAHLLIDLDAIAANYRSLMERTGPAEVAAVVKADAYGLGMAEIAPVLAGAGCSTFFVATPDEGLALRAVLSNAEIHVFNGPLPGVLEDMTHQRITPVLNSLYQINLWVEHVQTADTPPPVDLQLDTGMSRLGFPTEELATLTANPDFMAALDVDVVLSHLACADDPSDDMNARQLETFAAMTCDLRGKRRSLAASSGLYLGDEYHFDLVRPGIALYGGNPQPEMPNPMTQALKIKGKILQVRSVDTPQSVGYGAMHQVSGPAQIATVALGYADGYLRSFSDSGKAWIGEHEVQVAGRVSMDLTTIDVTGVPSHLVYPGALVDFIGPGQTVDQMASDAGTIDYEILTRLGSRFDRQYTGGK